MSDNPIETSGSTAEVICFFRARKIRIRSVAVKRSAEIMNWNVCSLEGISIPEKHFVLTI
jgi:hypothetical protein